MTRNIITSFLFILILFIYIVPAFSQNNAPSIAAGFPDTVITKQGVSNPDSIFALPLADFGFDADGDPLTWSTSTEDSITAFFDAEQDTLFVHSSGQWYGRGSFTIKLKDTSGAYDEKQIYVIAFKKDGTLKSPDVSKTEYYIPWHPQLDFNRIASVEEHMKKYYKPDIGLLDRKIHWSKWKKMKYIKGAQVVGWMNEQVLTGWEQNAQYASVDYTYDELRFIHCNGINYWRNYYLESQESPYPIEIFDKYGPGVSITDDDLRYVINEGHRKGFKVIISPHVGEPYGEGRGGFNPPDFDVWFGHYGEIIEKNAQICMETGVDGFVVGNIFYIPVTIFHYQKLTNDEWNQYMIDIHKNQLRTNYSGPTLYTPGCYEFVDYKNIIPLLEKVDIIGGNTNFNNYPVDNNPTVEQVESHITNGIEQYIDPLHTLLDKPFIMNEGGMSSFDGAIKLHDSSGEIWPPGSIYDGEEQAIWYEAYFSSEKKFDYIFGFGWFCWGFGTGHGGKGDLGCSPRLKPAEKVIEKVYGGYLTPRIIEVDGNFSDWTTDFLLVSDPIGDSKSDHFDLQGVYGIRDEMYTYIRIEFMGGLSEIDFIQYYIDLNNDNIPDMPGGIGYDDFDGWVALLNGEDMNWDELLGIMVVISDSNNSNFEFRIPNRLFNYYENVQITIETIDRVNDIWPDELQGYYNIPFYNTTKIENVNSAFISNSFKLYANYPNPFNSQTQIKYQLAKSGETYVKIYNLLGKEVKTISRGNQQAGIYTLNWDGKDNLNRQVPSGIYFILLQSGEQRLTRKVLLLR